MASIKTITNGRRRGGGHDYSSGARNHTELDMGPFLLTQSNPIHQLMDPIQSIKLPENPDPIQSKNS